MDRREIAIVIPAYNEATTIASVVKGARDFASVFVVDDCSADSTATLAADSGAIVISHSTNSGYDAALNTGFDAAIRSGCKYVISLDADGQHDPKLISSFIAELDRGADMVAGIRSTLPRMAERLFALYTTWRFGLTDPLCGLKAYRDSLYREHGCFDRSESIGTDLLMYGLRTHKRWAVVSVPIAPRQGSPRFAGKWRANLKILKALRTQVVKSLWPARGATASGHLRGL